MIKKFYCHQGLCPYQCMVTISHNIETFIPRDNCLSPINDLKPIWKEKSYVEGLEEMEL